VFPEPGVLGWTGSVAEFDTITPDDEVTPEVSLRVCRGEVLQWVGVPDPSVVREGKGARILEFGARSGGEAGEERLDEGRSEGNSRRQ
jgi:hypothetical protein